MKNFNILFLINLLVNYNLSFCMLKEPTSRIEEKTIWLLSLKEQCIIKIIEANISVEKDQNSSHSENEPILPCSLLEQIQFYKVMIEHTKISSDCSLELRALIKEVKKLLFEFFDYSNTEWRNKLILALPQFFTQKKLFVFLNGNYKLTNSSNIKTIYKAIKFITILYAKVNSNEDFRPFKLNTKTNKLLLDCFQGAIDYNLQAIFDFLILGLPLLPRKDQLDLLIRSVYSKNSKLTDLLKEKINLTESESYLLFEQLLYNEDL